MDMVSKFGKMEPNTKETGDSTKHVAMENSGTLMVMCLRVNGLTTRPMDTVSMYIRTVLDMKVNGKMIYNMAKVKKSGQIILDMKVPTMRVKNME